MNWQRARQPDQKAARSTAILEAAATLFDEKELAEISMRDVAERAGLGKASLYHYFKTKEEVFISLYLDQLKGWIEELQTRIGRLRAPNANRVSKSLTESLRNREPFCRLTAVFSSVLERNLSIEFIQDFKRSLLDPLGRFGAIIQSALPNLSDGALKEFLFQHHALIAGLWPLAHPSEEVSSVLQDDQFEGFRIDFYEVYQSTIEQLLAAK